MIIAFKTINEDNIFKDYLTKLEKTLKKSPQSNYEIAMQPFMNVKVLKLKNNVYILSMDSAYIILGIIMYLLEITIFPTIIYLKIKQEMRKRKSTTRIQRISKTEIINHLVKNGKF